MVVVFDRVFVSAAADASGAIEMTMMDIPDSTRLLEPKLNIHHFRSVLVKSHPSVAEEDLKPFEEFTESYGQEGV